MTIRPPIRPAAVEEDPVGEGSVGIVHLDLGDSDLAGLDLDALARSIDLREPATPEESAEGAEIGLEFEEESFAPPPPPSPRPRPSLMPPPQRLRAGDELMAMQRRRIDELIAERDAIRSELSRRAETVQAEAEALKQQLARRALETEQLRKRLEKEKEEAQRFGVERLVRSLLLILDNLQLAVDHAGKSNPEALADGVRMVTRQFEQAFERNGIVSFSGKGERFDPALHQAIEQRVTDEAPPGTVVAEAQRGYLLQGRLLRPAMVTVSRAPEPVEAEPGLEASQTVEPDARVSVDTTEDG